MLLMARAAPLRYPWTSTPTRLDYNERSRRLPNRVSYPDEGRRFEANLGLMSI